MKVAITEKCQGHKFWDYLFYIFSHRNKISMDDSKINIANINLLDDDFDLVHQSLPASQITGEDLLQPKPSTLNFPEENDVNSCNQLETFINNDIINDKHQPEEPNLEENHQKPIDTTHVDEADSIIKEKQENIRNKKVGE